MGDDNGGLVHSGCKSVALEMAIVLVYVSRSYTHFETPVLPRSVYAQTMQVYTLQGVEPSMDGIGLTGLNNYVFTLRSLQQRQVL